MSDVRPTSQAERDETPSQRADRNLIEGVQELRVAQTGVQILFAFLLSLAFLPEFPQDEPVFRSVLAGALLTAAAAAACFIAPVASHRLHFRRGRKELIVLLVHWMSSLGLALLLASMCLGIWLVMAHLWDSSVATWVAAACFVVGIVLWVALPLIADSVLAKDLPNPDRD